MEWNCCCIKFVGREQNPIKKKKLSGTNPKFAAELDESILDLIERFNEADSERKREANERKFKIENEFTKVQEMRQGSLETYCQVKKKQRKWSRYFPKKEEVLIFTGLYNIL